MCKYTYTQVIYQSSIYLPIYPSIHLSSIYFFVNLSSILEKGMTTHSSILAWRIPQTEDPGRLQSMGLQRVRYNWSDLAHTNIWLFVILWTVACQAPLTMRFFRKEYWSWLPFPSPGDLPNPRDGTCVSCTAGRFLTYWTIREALLSLWLAVIVIFYHVSTALSI